MREAHERSLPLTTLNEEEQLFRDLVREFAEEKVKPLVMEMDRAAKLPRELIDQLFALGVMGIEIPTIYGGAGSTFFMAILAIEELARVDPSVSVCVDVQNTLVNNALLRWLTPAQKEQFLPRLARDTVGAYALSEPGSGSDAFSLTTQARLDGDTFVLNGRKLWTTNGGEAGLYLDPGRRAGAAHARGRRDGPGLQGSDRDPQRRPHWHRRADDRIGPGRIRGGASLC